MHSRTTRRLRAKALVALGTAALILAPLPASAAETPVTVANGSFEQFAGVNPDGWSRWAAAGTGTVSRVAGVAGANAVQITTDTTASRLALVQDVPIAPGGGLYRLEFSYRLSDITGGGKAGIRVNFSGATGASSPFFGGNQTTAGWVKATEYLRAPSGTTGLRLHVFNDMVRGTMVLDDIRLTKVEGTNFVTSRISGAGDIALSWDIADTAGVATYDIYRSEGGVVDVGGDPLRSVPASVMQTTDQDWVPGATYRYVVVGRDAVGAELFRTAETPAITAPATSNVWESSIVALNVDDKTHVSWGAARDVTGPLSVYAADRSLADGDLAGATEVASGVEALGSVDLEPGATHFALVADDEVIATASRAASEHPRILFANGGKAKVERLIAQEGTPSALYDKIVSRVDGGAAAAGTSADRYAAEAGFVYQVTGEQRYADLAFDAFRTAAEATPFYAKQALDSANPAAYLALAYDWAVVGWTDAQRSYALDYFERIASFLEISDHPNMVWDDKASNWVAVTRGAELAVHLAARGDGDHGLRDARIARVLDQLTRHSEQGYTDAGGYQEGLDYLDYDNMIASAGVLSSFDAGIDAIKEEWNTPALSDMLLHTVSLRSGSGASLQWGVGTGGQATWPLYLGRAADDGNAGRIAAMYERTQGHLSASQWYSPAFALHAFRDWPEGEPIDLRSEEILPALFDDEAGSAYFRNRVEDVDDVLVGLTNRNHTHLGWSGYDTFGLSLIGGNTTWGTQPAKDQTNAAKYSRVLVDGKAVQTVGKGKTLASMAYEGQGGGYVHFDGAGNLEVDSARREAVVDMTTRAAADTILAVSDSFADDTSHTWTWQLAPQVGVTAEIGDVVDGSRAITLRNGDSWLRAWLLDAAGAEVTFDGGVLRIVRTGQTADFDIVLALGASSEAPEAQITGDLVSLDGFVADLSQLGSFAPVSAAPAWSGSTAYEGGDRVSFEGSLWEAWDESTGQEPGSKTRGAWQEIAETADTVLWTATRGFERGDVVLHDGVRYTAQRPTRAQTPGGSLPNVWEPTAR